MLCGLDFRHAGAPQTTRVAVGTVVADSWGGLPPVSSHWPHPRPRWKALGPHAGVMPLPELPGPLGPGWAAFLYGRRFLQLLGQNRKLEASDDTGAFTRVCRLEIPPAWQQGCVCLAPLKQNELPLFPQRGAAALHPYPHGPC